MPWVWPCLGPVSIGTRGHDFLWRELSTLKRKTDSSWPPLAPQGVAPSRSTPNMFLFLIPAWAGMWPPGQGPRSYFGVSFAWGGLGHITLLPQALASRSPLALASESIPSQFSSYHPFPTSHQRESVKQRAQGLNLTVPKLESTAESQEKLLWPPAPLPRPQPLSPPLPPTALGLGRSQGDRSWVTEPQLAPLGSRRAPLDLTL